MNSSAQNDEDEVSKFTIDQVLDKANEYMDQYNYEMCQMFCQRALEMDADNVRALELTSTLLLEAGDTENAKHCLGRAITVAPEEGHSKYLSLAQMLEGTEALSLYRKGIELMEQKQKSASLNKELSSSYCAVAELFMTDLCDLDEAEAECGACIEKAVQADDSNPEAWQTKARLHLIKTEFEESKSCMEKSLSLWLPQYMNVLEDRATSADPVDVCPLPYTIRLASAKILMELEDWDNAVQVLKGLIEEDELVVDTWYLLGLTNKLRADFEATNDEDGQSSGESHKSNARYYLKKALKVHSKSPTDDDSLISHVKELLEELGPGKEDDDKSDEEEDWEDCGSEDDEEEAMDSWKYTLLYLLLSFFVLHC